jgi:hypothetical protein
MTRTTVSFVSETNLFDFFHERVESAVVHQRAPVTENAVYYLSNLLAEQVRGDEAGAAPAQDVTLVELRHRAVSAPPGEAFSIWKQLGDTSLLATGFFREHLERRRISRDYYERMGASAYHALGRMLSKGSFAEIFEELAQRYHACVEVIAEVRDEARERNDVDIVKLYEEWLTTGSPRVAERLRSLGVVPTRFTGQV